MPTTYLLLQLEQHAFIGEVVFDPGLVAELSMRYLNRISRVNRFARLSRVLASGPTDSLS